MKNKKMSIIEKSMNIVLDILIFIFGVILLISIYNGIQVKLLKKSYSDFFGFSIFEVQTGSMSPTINAGDWIMIKANKSPNLNDIVTYEQNGDFITHRIIESYKGTYVTKGDANNAKDNPISSKQIVGKVIKILPNFGIIRKTIFNPIVLMALIVTIYVTGLVFKNGKHKEAEDNKMANNVLDNIKKIVLDVKDKIVTIIRRNHPDENIPIDSISEIKEEKSIITPVEPEEVKSVNVDDKKEEINVAEVKSEIASLDSKPMSEEDLDKTIFFRSISVDKDDISGDYLSHVETSDDDENATTNSTQSEDEIKPEEEVSDSIIKSKLELLNKKKKKSKNIIERIMFIKSEEINEILTVLNHYEKMKPNEATIKESFLKNYVDGKYYNYCGDVNVEYNSRNMTVKIDEVITETAAKLSKQYKGSDDKYNDKVAKYCDLFTLVTYLEQGYKTLPDINSKRELYKKKIVKYLKGSIMYEDDADKMIEDILKIQKTYNGIINFTFKKLETNTFVLKANQTAKKNVYGLELDHNINFSKVYSDYIVDKTYDEGIIAEDKIMVLANLLLIQIAHNMLSAEFKNKYILYIPVSLYDKESKLNKLFKLIEDEYAKNNIIILIKYEDIIKNKKLVKGLRKIGYKFAIAFNEKSEVKAKDQGILYVADYLFIDKKVAKNSNVVPTIPDDLHDNIILDDVSEKVENFGGE